MPDHLHVVPPGNGFQPLHVCMLDAMRSVECACQGVCIDWFLFVCFFIESGVRGIKSRLSVGTVPSGSHVGSALVSDRCFLGAVPVAGGVSAPSVLRSPKMTP